MKESEGSVVMGSGVRGSGVRGEGVGGEGVRVEVGGGGASDPDEDPSEGVPEAEPPVCPKDKLFTNPDIFKEQDRRAIEVIVTYISFPFTFRINSKYIYIQCI